MTGGPTDTTLHQRVEKAMGEGQRCVSCFVRLLQEEGTPIPGQVAELARALERGIGGSGSVCGVFLAALLSLAIERERTLRGTGSLPSQYSPINEWLDAFTPFPTQGDKAECCFSLAQRLASFAREQFGGVECQRISGVEWPFLTPGLGGLYLSGQGLERCTRFIVEAAQAYLDALAPEERAA